jgi:hypothetical protein
MPKRMAPDLMQLHAEIPRDLFAAVEAAWASRPEFKSRREFVESALVAAVRNDVPLPNPLFAPVSQDGRVGGAIAAALACLQTNDVAGAVEVLTFARRVIFEAQAGRMNPAVSALREDTALRGAGSDTWDDN